MELLKPIVKPIATQLATFFGVIGVGALVVNNIQMDTINILQIINAENVLSVLVVIVVVGGGRWFVRDVWPWVCSYLEERQQLEYRVKLKQIEVNHEAEMRWQALVERMTGSFATLQNVLGKVENTLRNVETSYPKILKALEKVTQNANTTT